MPVYSWKRFWCPRGGAYALSDNGYLFDPDDSYGKQINPELATLDSFSDVPCLVLLGEPGTGKSTEFEAEVCRVQSILQSAGDAVIRVDLKEYQTDQRLIDDAFASQVIREWKSSDHGLHLYFDSLDEGRLEVRNIANILAGQFRKLRAHSSRLRLRIACRTAEWPVSLEEAITEIWGKVNVRIVELTPLRERDVIAAAESERVDTEQFLAEIAARQAQPFAIIPVTLKFLLVQFASTGALPSTRHRLYEQGCLHLCDELSQTRIDSGHFGNLSAAQRLEIASRIAAATVFTGRTFVAVGSNASPPDNDITPASLSGGFERVDGQSFAVTESGVRETLRTALFSGHGLGRLGFAHRTFPEFLAARYLARRNTDCTQIGSLIFHPENEGKVIPQLAETAAWIALADDRTRERILFGDPQVLLRSDVAANDDEFKQRLLESVLAGLQRGELDDSDWSLRTQYAKFANSKLAMVLEPVLRDTTVTSVARRFCADVAEACREAKLLDGLRDVALDQMDDPHIRAQAAHAIVAIGDRETLKGLIPLALGNAGPDPDDELRGAALSGLWPPRYITAADLFGTLSRPRRESYFGQYRHFLSHELPQTLKCDDLTEAIPWCCKQMHVHCSVDDFWDSVVAIIQIAIRNLNNENVFAAFTDYLLTQIMRHDVSPLSHIDTAFLQESDRKRIVTAVLPRLGDLSQNASNLFEKPLNLMKPDDLSWTLEQAEQSTEPDAQQRWSEMARFCFLHGTRANFDVVLDYCDSNAIVAGVFSDLFQPIPLNGEAATRLRGEHKRNLDLERQGRQRREPPELTPPPSVRVDTYLAECEAGSRDGWWHLNFALQMEPRAIHRRLDLCDNIQQFPGWIAGDSATRARILSAAKSYLRNWNARPNQWLGTRRIHYPDFAAYRALVLIEKQEPTFLESLDTERWANLSPVIIGFPTSNGFGGEAESTQQRLAGLAYRNAPESMIGALRILIDGENRDQQNKVAHLSSLSRVDLCRDERFAQALFRKARDPRLRPEVVASLIEDLMTRDPLRAEELAKSLVAKGCNVPVAQMARRRSRSFEDRRRISRGQDSPRIRRALRLRNSLRGPIRFKDARRLSTAVAAVAWVNRPASTWTALWPQFQRDLDFFREVAEEVAHGHRQSRIPPVALTADQLADLYILLSREFPQSEDPCADGAHCVGPRESIQHYRDNILGALRDSGTAASCSAISRIAAELPHLQFLGWTLRAARRAMLRLTWSPPSIAELRSLLEQPSNRLVRSDRDLQRVVLESLERLQQRLQGETPAAVDLWNYNRQAKTWEPKDENAFSDYVARHLRDDLTSCGIVAMREVEIRRGNAGSGEETDVYVTGVVFDPDRDRGEVVRVIVEAKGCWHRELRTAMETQLRNRYIRDNDCRHGVYLVGWFECDSWSDGDYRRGDTPKWTIDEARDFFGSQAEQLSNDDAALKCVVLNTSLR